MLIRDMWPMDIQDTETDEAMRCDTKRDVKEVGWLVGRSSRRYYYYVLKLGNNFYVLLTDACPFTLRSSLYTSYQWILCYGWMTLSFTFTPVPTVFL